MYFTLSNRVRATIDFCIISASGCEKFGVESVSGGGLPYHGTPSKSARTATCLQGSVEGSLRLGAVSFGG